MKKNMNICIDLKTIMQEDALLNPGQCYRGVLSRTEEDVYLFEEAAPANHAHRRNPKLYEGQYVSLVHRSDNKYACTLKCITPKTEGFDHHNVAFRIYLELIDALQIIR